MSSSPRLKAVAAACAALLGAWGLPAGAAEPDARTLDAPTPPRQKVAIPAPADLQKAEKDVREVFRKEYQEKDPALRRALAEKLLAQGVETRDNPAAQYVLLREARDLAAAALLLETAFRAVDRLAERFDDVKPLDMKSAVLAAARKAARTPDEAGGVAEFDLALADSAVDEGDFKTALAAAKSAEKTATAAKNADLAQRAGDLAREIPDLEREWEAVRKAEAVLATAPGDPAACLVCGKHLCFAKGDWGQGLPLLAKGSDAGLAEVARLEGAKLEEADALAALAEKWQELAKKCSGALDRRRFQGRAVELYQSASAAATGFLKAKIEKRLEELGPRPGARSGWLNLLALVDPQKDAVKGTWTLRGGALTSDATWAVLEFPYQPPDEYDFRIVFTRLEGKQNVAQIITRAGHTFNWCNGAISNTLFGFEMVNGASLEGNATKVRLAIENGRPQTSVVQVRRDGVKGLLNGRLVSQLKTDYTNVSPHFVWKTRGDGFLGIGSHESPTTFHRVEVLEVSGKGRRAR